ncbi:hypothetical protein HOK51_07335 [Candidatus Woesearchaeota archaeon]|jgi:hypothetical protein|nr:hypothetical protein [Candidatus Woesearchaeota archaeon]MBT6519635.1 hypothetical protein [Candidatus Woesearchaeota archaeon]MBT7367550.1 hypothetical protein [Candidatus Woesearchaeota archaeon]
MASFLDIGLVSYFGVIFPILLIFVIVFAILQKTDLFGDNKGLQSIVAFCVAMITTIVPGVLQVINIMAPWFVLLFIFFTLLLISLKFLGVSDVSITTYMSKDWETAHWFVLSLALVIFIGSIATVYGSSLLPYSDDEGGLADDAEVGDGDLDVDTGNFNANVGALLFHPKTIGMVFVLLIGSFTIRLLAGKA